MSKEGKSWPEEGAKLPSKQRPILCGLNTTLMAHKKRSGEVKVALCLRDGCPPAERSFLDCKEAQD